MKSGIIVERFVRIIYVVINKRHAKCAPQFQQTHWHAFVRSFDTFQCLHDSNDEQPLKSHFLKKPLSKHGRPSACKPRLPSEKTRLRTLLRLRRIKDLEVLLSLANIARTPTKKEKLQTSLLSVKIKDSMSMTTPSVSTISLSGASQDWEGKDRVVEGAGYVAPQFLNDEDDGQLGDAIDLRKLEYIGLSPIIGHSIDYTKKDAPVCIETAHAFYLLQTPSQAYQPFFHAFNKPQQLAQLAISEALKNPNMSYDHFMKKCIRGEKNYLTEAIPYIMIRIEEHDNPENLRRVPFLKVLLSRSLTEHHGRRQFPRRRLDISNIISLKNIDLAVLQPEYQTVTRVTPLIQKLAASYFQEFRVLGSRPESPDEKTLQRQERLAFSRLKTFIARSFKSRRMISFRRDQRLSPRSNWLRSVMIDGEQYQVGDIVAMPIGQYGTRPVPDLPHADHIPSDATIEDYFWFAKVIYVSEEHETAHVQWFWHSTTTAIQELSEPQELFLAELCDTIKLQSIVGKIKVHHVKPNAEEPPKTEHDEFFYRFTYDSFLATYTDIDNDRIKSAEERMPPNNCPVCLLIQQRDREMQVQRLPTGFTYLRMNFHVHDFVLIRSDDGPCKVGHIICIEFRRNARRHPTPMITVKLLGRVSQLANIVPQHMKDDRHLFLTDEEEGVGLDDLIRPCFVFPHSSIPDDEFESWITLSPDHFYAKYYFRSMNVKSWGDRRLLHHEIDVCIDCCREKVAEFRSMQAHTAIAEREPLLALDLFGGVGAFGLGMTEGKFIKTTHTIEISPSAARTFKRNSPETIVYNNCANVVLQYAFKTHRNKQVERPVNFYDSEPLPDPPQPGDVEVILAGFPCQSHSSLNMFRKADDAKNGLILTTLSWIDFLKPKLCVLENVRGFFQFNLASTQVSKHRVEGGIEMGGLKLVVRALVDMNYQVRFGLLQAGHYGIPQTRVRFFLIAAQSGFPLPEFPQPSHHFPVHDALAIKLLIGDDILPIRTAVGTAPHAFVTVDDAIGDLPRFDWKNPRHAHESIEKQRRARERERDIPAIVCDKKVSHCGYKGVVRYHHEPRTNYQSRSRAKATGDLQQYTRVFDSSKVEKVYNIPLRPKADYKSQKKHLQEWQLTNPASAVGKGGFRSGWYGRLDKDGWFSTTVTNVDPTAKQSKVLHPHCKRMITVRELARSQGFPDSFVFESVTDSVITLHRQIGNAVPWLVAVAIGQEIRKTLFTVWMKRREEDEGEGNSHLRDTRNAL